MQFNKFNDRIIYLRKLIEQESTGTPDELASRLGISRRMVFEYLNELKGQGARLAFNKKKKSYYYFDPKNKFG